MRRFFRGPAPEFLALNWESWGRDWEARRNSNPAAQFSWRTVEGERVNQKLLPQLKALTQDHCSFCDNYPVSPPSIDTIEHFRPKSKYPRVSYLWTNLYFCCMACQQKADEFDEAALQPDAESYDFDRYFRWDFTKGTLKVNERATQEDQRRAQVTIQLYRLNERHPSLRIRAQRFRACSPEMSSDDFAYRHFLAS